MLLRDLTILLCPLWRFDCVSIQTLQAFKRWLPSITDENINVLLTTKSHDPFKLVNIISYDLLVKMNREVQEKRFMAIIAVREMRVFTANDEH